jgi:ankyrin repeat protein
MSSLAAAESNSPLMTLPNELLFEVASHVEHFRDLNSLLRTSTFFYDLANPILYRRAVAAKDIVREEILEQVISQHQIASLELLLDNGLCVDQRLPSSRSGDSEDLLGLVCDLCSPERSLPLARLLIDRGADIKAEHPRYFHTALHVAVAERQCDIAKLLLARGADPDAADIDGLTPLHYTTSAKAAEHLILYGAEIDARSDKGETPLLMALYGWKDIVPILLAHGADVNAHNNRGLAALHFMCNYHGSYGHKVLKLLVERGADVNATDNEGSTPLHWMANSGNSDLFMSKFLLENGADVNAISTFGLTPLQEVFEGWYRWVSDGARNRFIELLIKHGADVSVLDRTDGRQAVWMDRN